MKKLTILFALSLIFTSAFNQRIFDNEFYLRLGYSSPSWTQFGLTKDEWNKEFKKLGFITEMGTIFALNSMQVSQNLSLGIDITYVSLYFHLFSSNDISENIGTLRVASKIGPSFTYSPENKLSFNTYVKADVSWLTVTTFISDDNIDDALFYRNIGTIGLSTGINVSYSILMLGFEYNTISPKLENIDHKGNFLGNFGDSNSNKTSMPSISFTLGLRLRL